jgi:uncharacterized protein (TIGR02147 family)
MKIDTAKRNTCVSIFEYIDFRKYLNDYYLFHKKHSNFFSYRYFSQKAGFSSHNVLKFVILGSRNISQSSIDKFAKALNLSEKESAYFRLIVLFGQTKNEAEKNLLFKEIFSYRKVSEAKKVDKLNYRMYSDWHTVAIREIIGLKDFKEDHALIARTLSPSVRPHQVKNSIKLLLDLGLIRRDPDGKLVQSDPIIKTETEVASLSISNYTGAMIEHAASALHDVDPSRREISAMTVAISKNMVQMIKQKIQGFKDELLSDIVHDTTPSEEVYQINFQLFPLLKKER